MKSCHIRCLRLQMSPVSDVLMQLLNAFNSDVFNFLPQISAGDSSLLLHTKYK